MTTCEVPETSWEQINRLLAKICDRALERQDFETARDADYAIRLLRARTVKRAA